MKTKEYFNETYEILSVEIVSREKAALTNKSG